MFDGEKMIDFVNKGNNRKVNFVILPSLFSHDKYLQNGKFWVFTYKKGTFRFCEPKFENLVNKKENEKFYKHMLKSNGQISKREKTIKKYE